MSAPRRKVALGLGLKEHEFEAIQARLKRLPSVLELSVFAGMWSEHCSYKSTRGWLAELPRTAPYVLAGPGAHAGVVQVGDGWAVAFKIESHNHPSAVEPYQGAATGVGGILRDIVAAGARPIAIMDYLCFGDPKEARTRTIARGVVAGVSGYGNAIGVANLGGRTVFDARYQGNPLVNAMAVGLLREDEVRFASGGAPGDLLLLVGAATGRDGILGAAFASEELGDTHHERRSHVQVGDPFGGKLLLEACLSFNAAQGLKACQDLGACGLTCAATELAEANGCGVELELDAVPLREPDMSAHEILLSESQERFAFVVEPSKVDQAIAHFKSHRLHAAVVGRLTSGNHFVAHHRGERVLDLPADFVAKGTPAIHWPLAALAPLPPEYAHTSHYEGAAHKPTPAAMLTQLLKLHGSSRPVFKHYDQTVGNLTVRGPGTAAAAVLRLPGQATDPPRGMAFVLTGHGPTCARDPYHGTLAAMGLALRALACVGADMMAITDGLNFGSPSDPQQAAVLATSIRAIRDGLRTLGIPVTGGNVSLYNESPVGAIPPSPMIGSMGLVPDLRLVPWKAGANATPYSANTAIVLLGALQQARSGSSLGDLLFGVQPVTQHTDLHADQMVSTLVRNFVRSRTPDQSATFSALPVSSFGLLTTLAGLLVERQAGAQIQWPTGADPLWAGFGEYAGQVLVLLATDQVLELQNRATAAGVDCTVLGSVSGPSKQNEGASLNVLDANAHPWLRISLTELTQAWNASPAAEVLGG